MTDFIVTLFLGFLGVHKFKQGKTAVGILYFCTLGLFGVGWFVDIVLSLKKALSEASAVPVVSATAKHPSSKLTKLESTNEPLRERHKIAGTSYRQKEIQSLGIENPDFKLSKKELLNRGLEDETIYNYVFSPSNVELAEEPDNKYDPNAVKVIIDGVHIGYIKKGSCSRIKNLIHADKIAKIEAEIRGGKYRLLYSDYEDDSDKSSYRIDTGSSDFSVSICIYTK